jgi:type IV secretory pathway VirD2 relaxase
MAELEKELGTKLQWMAGVHEKPDAAHERNRHAHIVIRGIDDGGGDLVLGREFIRHELRRIAEELATRRLGQMSQREMDAHIARQAERQREGRENYDLGYRAKGWEDRGQGQRRNRGKAKGEGLDHG